MGREGEREGRERECMREIGRGVIEMKSKEGGREDELYSTSQSVRRELGVILSDS